MLLPIFTEEESKENKMAISAVQHRENLEDHVRSLAALCEGIRREFKAWHAAFKSQADSFGQEKPLVMTVAKHLTGRRMA